MIAQQLFSLETDQYFFVRVAFFFRKK
jgi:hypothetical protein